jgi:quercetin dioxygenase-like cupin family protein
MKKRAMNPGDTDRRAPAIKSQPRSKRCYFDVALGCVRLSGADTGGHYRLLELSLASGMRVPRHTHTREDEVHHVLSGELEVAIADDVFILRAGDILLARPRL